MLFLIYQGTFAIITAALISGAVVDAVRALRRLHRALDPAGVRADGALGLGRRLARSRGVLDFAGGTVVHINAGISAVVAATVLGVRKDYGRQAILPHNVPFVLLGAGLLWFGWFASTAAARSRRTSWPRWRSPTPRWPRWRRWSCGCCWTSSVRPRDAVGAATAIVVGLVAITPAAGFVSPGAALLLGGIAAFPSYFVIVARSRTRLDDSLDVFAGHGVGGILGHCSPACSPPRCGTPPNGLLAGNPSQLAIQALGVGAAIVYSAVATFALLKVLGFVTALRAAPKTEGTGMDVTQHGEGVHQRRRLDPRHLGASPGHGARARPEPADRGALTPEDSP